MNSFQDERKKDQFFLKAKREGYRSRASYKLSQIQEHFKILPYGGVVIDLGAAPGGWSQMAADMIGKGGTVLALDIKDIAPFRRKNIVRLKYDMREERLAEIIHDYVDDDVDTVLCDVAGDVTGNWTLDHNRQIYLVQLALMASFKILKKGGNFVSKVFHGEHANKLEDVVKKCFEEVSWYKPTASRKKSAEVYIVAKGYNGKKIDPVEEMEKDLY
ncbi:MAG: SAM-dependent methyltransferase [Candidatus Kariarchaeaceae archaeon]